MTSFTFFLDDGTIHEATAPDKDAAFRLLCLRLGRSWVSLHPHVLDCLSPGATPTL